MARPKVLLTRRIPKAGMSILEERSELDIGEQDGPMGRDELLGHVRGVDGLLCMLSDRIDRELIDSAPNLKVISNYAVGTNNIDLQASADRGIIVTNTPGVLREATADLAWALLMAAARRIPESDRLVRSGEWQGWGPEQMLGRDVFGSTIGIIGMGDIGAAVARRAKGFGMDLLYHNRRPSPAAKELGAMLVPLDELLRRSDFVSLHVPSTGETKHLIGEAELAMMKPTAILVNASRGTVIDEAALVRALKEKRIAAAGLDAYEDEPRLAPGLAELDNVVLTPHTGSATHATRERMAVMAAEDLLSVLEGRKPKNLVVS